MALKLNIRPELDAEIDQLYSLAGARSKTEYINMAIAEMNRRQKRKHEIGALKAYFEDPKHRTEEETILSEFSAIRGKRS